MFGIGAFIARIGFRAIAGRMLGKAAGAGGSALKWLGSLDLVHMLLLVLALFGAWQTVGRWVQHRHTVKVEGQLSETSGRLTAARKDLATSQANEAALKKAIADQNKAISDISASSAHQQHIASKTSQAAAKRARDAEGVAARLRRSAAGKSAPVGNCEPSDVLKSQWSQ